MLAVVECACGGGCQVHTAGAAAQGAAGFQQGDFCAVLHGTHGGGAACPARAYDDDVGRVRWCAVGAACVYLAAGVIAGGVV